jgi:hypothetical protein
MQMPKNLFSEYCWYNGKKNSHGNIVNQGLGAYLRESKFEGWTAEQTVLFCTAILLGGHGFEVNWIHFRFQMAPVGGGWQDKKSAMTFFRPGRYNICTFNSEMKAKWRCCRGKMGAETQEKAVASPCNQQFTIKRGVTRLPVSQFSGNETKWSPMVPWFLLHDAADMSIGGVSGKRKFSLWGGMLEGYCRS